MYFENISEGTQEMPQSQSTALSKHQMKKRWEKIKTDVTYETTDAQTSWTATVEPPWND